ncbi:MAG: DUF58 domain-containing protein [Planctomycetota bacterium]|nr:DUF58 domain-containing protein [Planctomycetota bacterium]
MPPKSPHPTPSAARAATGQPRREGNWIQRLGPGAAQLLAKLRDAVSVATPSGGPTAIQRSDIPTQYLDPAVLTRVGLTPMLAKLIVEGFLNGLHKSPFHGFSVEFADHREYVPGDDLKFIDWHLYARTDHYYIKRFEEETNLRCFIVLDRSASMGYGTGALTKWDYACFLGATLGYMMLKQQDAVGLALFGAKPGLLIPARCRSTHLRQMMQAMVNSEPTGTTDVTASLRAIARNLKRRGLVVVISDLIDDPDATLKALRLLRSHRHDVLVFHVQDAAELDFGFQGATLFRDMETGQELEIDPDDVRDHYLEKMNELTEFYRKGLTEVGIDYQLINTREPYDTALSAYLHRRFKTHK